MIVMEIRCNECDIVGDSSAEKTAGWMRSDLRKRGWLVNARRTGKQVDLCPECYTDERIRVSAGLGR